MNPFNFYKINAIRLIEKAITYGKMIKFSHTLFALPFALSAIVLASRKYIISFIDIFLIIIAMAGARSAAMGFNRIVDAKVDKKNPRTKNREIPSEKLKVLSAVIFVAISSALFIFASFLLSWLCFFLSFPVLVLLFAYSFTKRFTWLCHIYLGLAISLAPIGAWLALTKGFSWHIILLSLALLTYIAGFDILYSLQDINFDRKEGLLSIPTRFGIAKSLFIAKILHVASFFFLLLIYPAFGMNKIYFTTVIIIGSLFAVEHLLVKNGSLKHINIAFFHVNTLIAIILFAGIFADTIIIIKS